MHFMKNFTSKYFLLLTFLAAKRDCHCIRQHYIIRIRRDPFLRLANKAILK